MTKYIKNRLFNHLRINPKGSTASALQQPYRSPLLSTSELRAAVAEMVG